MKNKKKKTKNKDFEFIFNLFNRGYNIVVENKGKDKMGLFLRKFFVAF